VGQQLAPDGALPAPPYDGSSVAGVPGGVQQQQQQSQQRGVRKAGSGYEQVDDWE
jgi:hypothetical protein